MKKNRKISLQEIDQSIEEAELSEIKVAISDAIEKNQVLLILETNKTTIELGSPFRGIIRNIFINIGESITNETILFEIEETEILEEQEISNNVPLESRKDLEVDLVVIGGGPAGYTAAFRAADLGLKTIIIDKYPELGGTCLNSGCIPSKFLLHIISGIHNAKHLSDYGVKFDEPFIDLRKMMKAKDNVINTLNIGLRTLSAKRNIEFVCGEAKFLNENTVSVKSQDKSQEIKFSKAIIATGSNPRNLDEFDSEDPRIRYSEQALNIQCIPDRMLVIGGGVIGLELSSVYHGLGTEVTVIEASDVFLGMLDADIVTPLLERYGNTFHSMMTNTTVSNVESCASYLTIKLKQGSNYFTANYDAILIATGRQPNTDNLNLDNAAVKVNKHGFIPVDSNFRTSSQNIYAIGDVIGNPMLAHKGAYEGRVVAEICASKKEAGDTNSTAPLMPFVIYTEPEIAWVGATEKDINDDIDVVNTSWASNGRALTQDSTYGITKLLINKNTGVIIGGGIVGPNAGDMLSEITLAVENKITVKQLSSMIHPHPTMAETIGMCAEIYLKEAIEVLN